MLVLLPAPVAGGAGTRGDLAVEIPEGQVDGQCDDHDEDDGARRLGDPEGSRYGIDEPAVGQPFEAEERCSASGQALEPVGRGYPLQGVPQPRNGPRELRDLDYGTDGSHDITLRKGPLGPERFQLRLLEGPAARR